MNYFNSRISRFNHLFISKNSGCLLIFALFFSLSFSLFGQEPVNVSLRTGALSLIPNLRQDLIDKELEPGKTNEYYYTLVAFDQLPSLKSLNYLKFSGVELLEKLFDNTYVVRFRKKPDVAMLRTSGIKAVKSVPYSLKTSATINNKILNQHGEEIVKVSIKIYAKENFARQIKSAEAIGFTVVSNQYADQGIYIGNIPGRQLAELASLPFVSYVNLFDYKAEPLLQPENGAYGLTNLKGGQIVGKQLSGKGITVGVGDNADPTSHIDLVKNLQNRNPSPILTSAHGTRVAGIVSGDGLIEEQFTGVAPKTQLITDFFDYIISKSKLYKKDYGMSITNNSYFIGYTSCPGNSDYNELSVFADEQIYQDTNLMHVVASGNDGRLSCSSYPASYATIKSGYQTAKNVITVGNYTTNNPRISESSSRGPVIDGRIKPEIIAPGSSYWSTSINSTYTNGFGTSFASPTVTGVYSLLSERYKQMHNDSLPNAALMKAILCNTAVDKGSAGPDFIHGFGLIHPTRALHAIENQQYIKGHLNQGEQFAYNMSIPQGVKRIKVMLYWHDPAGTPNAQTMLQHDLDIQLINNNQTYLPWVLNATPNLVANPAQRGVDRINNIEQVTIDNPIATNIQLLVNGYSVVNGPQQFFVTWDYYFDEVKLLYPVGGEKFTPGITINYEAISWDAPEDIIDSLSIEYSTDEGANWNIIANNVPCRPNWYLWTIPNVAAAKAKVRLKRNSTNTLSVTPGSFTIMPRPTVSSVVPCEGAVDLSWSPINNVSAYDVYQLTDWEWIKIATTTGSTHSVRGLNKSTRYWFSVCPKVSDSLGRRSSAIAVTPNISTPCSSPEFDKDLKIDQLLSPVSGRKYTSTALAADHKIGVKIKNLDNVATSGSYELGYQINDGVVVREQSNITIPASSTIDYFFTTTADLSPVDSFRIKVFVKQAGDQRSENDEQTYLIRHLDNLPIALPHIDDFEISDKDEYRVSSFGLNKIERFDYTSNTTNGRLRTFVNTGMAPDGNRAITLDAAQYLGSTNLNQLTGTYNLQNLSIIEGMRLDFLYKNQGQLKLPNTALWVRGADTLPWVKAYEIDNSQSDLAKLRKGWVNLYELLTYEGHPLSTSFQIMIQQLGRSSSNNADYYTELFDLDDGLTIDQLRISNATSDLMLSAIVSPASINCSSQSSQQSVAVKIKNLTSASISNIPVTYKLGNNPAVTEIIPSIDSGAEIIYTFITPLTISNEGKYVLNAWVDHPLDDYAFNDSIFDYVFFNNGVINNYPYLERFEVNDGKWFTTTSYSSWQWGSTDPWSRALITSAANGNKAWFTSLSSGYNSNESSYLYTPCFNLSSLNNPVLSFSHISQQERGADFHLLEYSLDNGISWQRLGTSNLGTNWYDTSANYWNRSVQRWHVSSTDLPSGVSNIRFRFLMSSDDFNQAEGIGIDDFHIFEKKTVYEGANVNAVNQVAGNNFIDFVSQGNMIASINPLGQNLGTVNINAYFNTDSVRLINNQYYLDRNLVIRSQFNPTDSVLIRFYFTDNEVNKMLFTTQCTPCIKLNNAYQASVTKYDGAESFENGILNDGAGGTYEYIDASKVDVVPFNNGYYAEFKVKSFSEFWLHALNFNLTQVPVSVNNPDLSQEFIQNTMIQPGGYLRILTGNQPQLRDMHIRLMNANGQQVYQSIKPYQYTDIYLPGITSGIYFIEITDRSGQYKYRNKLIKP